MFRSHLGLRLPSCSQHLSKSKRLTEPDGCPTFAPAYVVPKTTFFECFHSITHCFLLTKNNGQA
jgi:hypothetical protein